MQSQIHRMKVEIEARAEWGDDVDSIRKWMYDQDTGISDRYLEKILRHSMMRKAGTLTTGGLIRSSAAFLLIVLAVILFSKNLPKLLVELESIPFILVVFAVLSMLVGVWLAFQGLDQLITGLTRTAEIPKPVEGEDEEEDPENAVPEIDPFNPVVAGDPAVAGDSVQDGQ